MILKKRDVFCCQIVKKIDVNKNDNVNRVIRSKYLHVDEIVEWMFECCSKRQCAVARVEERGDTWNTKYIINSSVIGRPLSVRYRVAIVLLFSIARGIETFRLLCTYIHIYRAVRKVISVRSCRVSRLKISMDSISGNF